jgi:hypothetical protein
MKNILNKIERWFDINIGWFFVNGRKQEEWHNRLEEKYR